MKRYTITKADAKDMIQLRNIRNDTVFPIINRGQLWYDSLTSEQLSQLSVWYDEWKNVTETGVVPQPLPWLDVDYEIAEEGA